MPNNLNILNIYSRLWWTKAVFDRSRDPCDHYLAVICLEVTSTSLKYHKRQ